MAVHLCNASGEKVLTILNFTAADYHMIEGQPHPMIIFDRVDLWAEANIRLGGFANIILIESFINIFVQNSVNIKTINAAVTISVPPFLNTFPIYLTARKISDVYLSLQTQELHIMDSNFTALNCRGLNLNMSRIVHDNNSYNVMSGSLIFLNTKFRSQRPVIIRKSSCDFAAWGGIFSTSWDLKKDFRVRKFGRESIFIPRGFQQFMPPDIFAQIVRGRRVYPIVYSQFHRLRINTPAADHY